MMQFLNITAGVIELANACVFYLILRTFMPPRGGRLIQILSVVCCYYITAAIIQPHEPSGTLLVLAGFLLYMMIFYKGDWAPKLSIAVILYPMLVSLNFITLDIGKQIYLALPVPHPDEGTILSQLVFTLSRAVHPLVWLAVWRISRRWSDSLIALLNTKMWLLLDSVCAAVLASLLVVLNYVSIADSVLSYPVAIAGMVTVVGCLYLIAYIAGSVQQNTQLERLQAEYQYYEDKQKDEKRIRAIYHDMKNHLLLLQSEHGGSDVQEMIDSLGSQIAGYESYYQTGNSFLDVIIRDKAEKAREHGIDFSAALCFEDGQFLDPLTISTIFGNALDNAIEASLALPVSERMIIAKANRAQEMLTIQIENQTAESSGDSMRTGKKDKLLHGFGLANIRQAVKQYDGECAIKQKNNTFSLSIILPIP